MAKKWIKSAIGHPGALHRALGVPEGEKIPADKMAAARNSKSPRVRKMAALAHTLGGMHHHSEEKSRGSKWYGGK